jgi:hypothetical protein
VDGEGPHVSTRSPAATRTTGIPTSSCTCPARKKPRCGWRA